MYVQKHYVSKFFEFSFSRYYLFRLFWGEKHSSLTSVIGDISYHATNHWKALEEYIPNIYTFMSQKSFIFLIVLSYWLFWWKNSWIHFRINIRKKYFLDLCIFIYTKRFLFKYTLKKTISLNFSSFLSRDITRSDIFSGKTIHH